MSTMQKMYAAELVGTFALTFAVVMSVNHGGSFPTPLIAGLTLGLFVYILGHVSGAHFNPAVTISLAALKKVSVPQAIGYVISQLIGGLLAMTAAGFFIAYQSPMRVVDSPITFWAEAAGAFVLASGVISVASGRTPAAVSGLVIGSSLTLGATIASLAGSNGIINPAVALGLGSLSPVYALAPVAGGVIAALAANFFTATSRR